MHSQQFTTHFRAAAADLELFFPSENLQRTFDGKHEQRAANITL